MSIVVEITMSEGRSCAIMSDGKVMSFGKGPLVFRPPIWLLYERLTANDVACRRPTHWMPVPGPPD